MKIQESDAKSLLLARGLPVPAWTVARTPAAARQAAEAILAGGEDKVVIKALVLVGGRGKAGGVKLAGSADEAEQVADAILGMNIKGITVQKVLVAAAADIVKEFYLAAVLDDASFPIALKRSVESAWMRDKIIAEVPTTVEQIHVRQILTYNEEKARTALEQLNGGADFNELAALYDPITRGELGWVPPGYLLDPKADEAVFALQAGAYSDVISTDAGFHIFKAVERADHLLTPDALLAMQELALENWIAEKRAKSDIILAP